MKLRFILFTLFLLGEVCSARVHSATSFPASSRAAWSPDKHFSISSVDHDSGELAYSLILKDASTGQAKKILDYGRHVDVAWAKDSSFFYVNDFAGSDFSTCVVLDPVSGEQIDLAEVMKKNAGADSALWSNHHRFITCSAWKKGDVIVSFAGNGDAAQAGFEQQYQFDPKQKVLRKLGKSK